MRVTDEMLFREARKAEQMILNHLPEEKLPEIEFSDKFEEQARKVIAGKRKKMFSGWYTKVAAAALVVLLLYGFGEVPTFSNLYEHIFAFVTVAFSDIDHTDNFVQEECSFGYLPDEMEMIGKEEVSEQLWMYTFQDKQGHWLTLRQEVLTDSSDMKKILFAEGEIETEIVHGVHFWKLYEMDRVSLVWEKSGILFYLEGNVDENTLLRVAENVR